MQSLVMGAILAIVLYWFVLYTEQDEAIQPKPLNEDQSLEYFKWFFYNVYVLLFILPQSELLATILRFDYENYEAAQPTSPIIAIARVPAPAGGLSTGVIAPSWAEVLRVPFKCYYFGTAMAAWVCSNCIVYTLTTRGVISEPYRYFYMVILLVISNALIAVAVVSMAWARGEVKQMWAYEEIWDEVPATEVPIAENPATTAESYVEDLGKVGISATVEV
ncbi:hypothetical protein HWV62_27091 [Athelia sp. TMB]|nr:hypothetical protein HWV62_27091 [Athelia sp. TMB]